MANFLWGAGGARMTPEEIAQQRKVSQSLMAQGMDYSPIASPWQGAARMAQALFGGLESGQADAASKQNAASSADLVARALGRGAAPAAGGAAPVAAPMSAPMGATAIPGADAIRSGLIERGLPEPVADGFLMNFRDESGLNPAINEAKPLVPGSRGGFGLAQWTGPRRVALEQFAQQSGRPLDDVNTQLDFLVKELQGPEAGAARWIMAAQTPQDAAVAIARDFLRPAQNNLDRRVAQYGGADPAALPANSMPTRGQTASRPAINPAILELISSPYVSDTDRKVGMALFQNQLEQQAKANDPMRALDMQLKQGQLSGIPLDNALKQKQIDKSDAPTSVQEYQFYRQQAEAAGEKPLPYSQWDTSRRRSSAVNVNTGTIPQGYELITDPATGAQRMQPIAGGPKDTSRQDQAKADARATSSDVVTNAAKLAREAISGATLPATGTAGAVLSNIGETGAAEVARQVAVLKSNATIENLNAMRAQSPTGGALGNVTQEENAMLAAKAGVLDQKSPNFLRDLDDYERTLLRIVHGKEAGDKIYEQTRPATGGGWQDVGGVKIRRKQ